MVIHIHVHFFHITIKIHVTAKHVLYNFKTISYLNFCTKHLGIFVFAIFEVFLKTSIIFSSVSNDHYLTLQLVIKKCLQEQKNIHKNPITKNILGFFFNIHAQNLYFLTLMFDEWPWRTMKISFPTNKRLPFRERLPAHFWMVWVYRALERMWSSIRMAVASSSSPWGDTIVPPKFSGVVRKNCSRASLASVDIKSSSTLSNTLKYCSISKGKVNCIVHQLQGKNHPIQQCTIIVFLPFDTYTSTPVVKSFFKYIYIRSIDPCWFRISWAWLKISHTMAEPCNCKLSSVRQVTSFRDNNRSSHWQEMVGGCSGYKDENCIVTVTRGVKCGSRCSLTTSVGLFTVSTKEQWIIINVFISIYIHGICLSWWSSSYEAIIIMADVRLNLTIVYKTIL